MYFYRSSLCVLTARVTVRVCHAGIKGYLLTYINWRITVGLYFSSVASYQYASMTIAIRGGISKVRWLLT